MALSISVKKHKGIPVLKLDGRVIGVDSDKLKGKFESLFKKKSEKIIVDISKTEFIDSNGLGIILYYHTLIQKNGRELILLNSNPSPQAYMTRLLEFTQLTNVFKVITSLEAL
jgi:anti-anti-sigma factor